MIKSIVIYGAGGFAREVLQVLHAINAVSPTWRCLGFIVEPGYAAPESLHDLPVFDSVEHVPDQSELWLSIAIGDPHTRWRVADDVGRLTTAAFPALVHPQAWIGDRVRLGAGTVVCAGAMITTDISLGEHVQVNLCATIGHDTAIGRCTTVSPGANISGRVSIGERVEIGTAASVIPGVEIGADCVIGASSAVIRSLPSGATAVGVPARVVRMRNA